MWIGLWAVFFVAALLEAPHLYRYVAQKRALKARAMWLELARVNLRVSQTFGFGRASNALDDLTDWIEETPVVLRRQAYASPPPKKALLAPRKIGSPAAAPNSSPIKTKAKQAVVRTKKKAPRRILLIGASSIALHLGAAFERELEKHGLSVYRYGKIATGIVRIDHFDWYKKLDQLDKRYRSDLAIAQLGANDCQVFVFKGKIVRVFTPKWRELFKARLAKLIKKMQRGGRSAVLIGVQNMRSKRFATKIAKLNALMKKTCESMSCTFIATWDLTSDSKGRYMKTVKVGKWRGLFRQQDGIHFTSHGARYMAPRLVQRLARHFVIPAKKQ
jgi:hypothetical protein